MEEERRLAFVAMTRGEKGLYLSGADGRNFDGSPRYPSRFLLDIDPACLTFILPLQESLIRFLQAAPSLENERHEKAWLLRVAGNLSKNRIAYNRLRHADQLEETLAAEQREDLSFVWEAVKRLPSSDREVIHLFYYEGFSSAEIAGILGQKESTVRSRLMRGREKLRRVLKEAYDFGESV